MLTQEYLQELFDYRDGNLYWKGTKGGNTMQGKKAGYVEPRGYTIVGIDEKTHKLHRLIYLYHHGLMPEFVDHIDNNPQNNRIENLRRCEFVQNIRNCRVPDRSQSRIKGVYWQKKNQKWVVHIRANKKVHYGGIYSCQLDAIAAMMRLRSELHGRFARNT